MAKEVLLKTLDNPPWYVCELRGVVFVSWVQVSDKSHALRFPHDRANEWRNIVEGISETSLVIEDVKP